MKILDSKMVAVKATEAIVIVTANPGCLLQMKLGIEREGLSGKVKAVHLADFCWKRLDTKHHKKAQNRNCFGLVRYSIGLQISI